MMPLRSAVCSGQLAVGKSRRTQTAPRTGASGEGTTPGPALVRTRWMGSTDYVFYERPSEVWAIEFINLSGERVVEVLGTESAARQAAEQLWLGAAVLLHSPTDFQPAIS